MAVRSVIPTTWYYTNSKIGHNGTRNCLWRSPCSKALTIIRETWCYTNGGWSIVHYTSLDMWQKVRPIYSAESTQGFFAETEKDLDNETNPSSEICIDWDCTQHNLNGRQLRPLRADLFHDIFHFLSLLRL